MYAWSLIWSLIKIRSLLDFYDTINARFIYILVFEPFENAHIHREKLVNRGLLKTDYVPANSIWIFRKNLFFRRVNSFSKRICFVLKNCSVKVRFGETWYLSGFSLLFKKWLAAISLTECISIQKKALGGISYFTYCWNRFDIVI